jgi:hypothetical protein
VGPGCGVRGGGLDWEWQCCACCCGPIKLSGCNWTCCAVQIATRVPLSLYLGPRLVKVVSLRKRPNSMYLQLQHKLPPCPDLLACFLTHLSRGDSLWPAFLVLLTRFVTYWPAFAGTGAGGGSCAVGAPTMHTPRLASIEAPLLEFCVLCL